MFETIKDMKILLVEDDEWIRDSLAMFFLGEGIRITALETAEEGIDAVKEERYDIIITDYRLPGMDGLAFLRNIKTLCPDAYKILITAYGGYEVITAAADLGVSEYVEKPFSTKTIRATLSRMVDKRR